MPAISTSAAIFSFAALITPIDAPKENPTTMSQVTRFGAGKRPEAYPEFTAPRKIARMEERNLINWNKPVVTFGRKGNPKSQKVVRGYEPDYKTGIIEISVDRGPLIAHYGGKVTKYRIVSKNRKIHDTLVLGQLLFADIGNDDFNNTHGLPGKVFSKRDYGSHSLKAWGQRIHCYKGDFVGGWDKYTEEMGAYCIQDTFTTKALFTTFEAIKDTKLLNDGAIELEYGIAPILARQQAYGVLFDKTKAEQLIGDLTYKLIECGNVLKNIFKVRYISQGEFTPKVNKSKEGIVKGHTFTKIKLEEFNPGSRIQIVDRLIKEFGWNPTEFTEKGQAKMNEDIIANLPYKELAPLKEYLTINKRLSQIEGGTQAWINKVHSDGRIRGAIRQNGAVTGRMAHFSPNMAQCPSNDSLYGKECRELFITPSNKIMIGCDADALEMRCLAGYLQPLDGGRFMRSILEGKKEDGTDAHSINMQAYQITNRDCAKTLFYAVIYGARNAKLGLILMDYEINFHDYVPDFENNVKGMIDWVEKKNKLDKAQGGQPIERTEAYWQCWVAGKHASKLFGDRIPELALLNEKIKAKIKEKGFIRGLDGRKLFCRTEHGALNTVLQSAGALIMKKALIIADQNLQKIGLMYGKDYEFILNVHDEWQLEVTKNEKIVDNVRNILDNSIKQAGEFFKFPCPMKGNSQIGSNWSETH